MDGRVMAASGVPASGVPASGVPAHLPPLRRQLDDRRLVALGVPAEIRAWRVTADDDEAMPEALRAPLWAWAKARTKAARDVAASVCPDGCTAGLLLAFCERVSAS